MSQSKKDSLNMIVNTLSFGLATVIKNFFLTFRIELFNILPIKKNRMVFISHLGKTYSCNPRYLCEYLNTNCLGKYELIWIYDCHFKKPALPKGVIGVPFFSNKGLLMLSTAKVIVSNTRISEAFCFKKRKKQIYLQTWHSSLRLKCIEGDANLGNQYEDFAKKDSKKIDIIISGSKFSTAVFKNSFWYNGLVLETGTPRIDWLRKVTEKESIFKKTKLDKNKHYLLYAPTFRKDGNLTAYNINYDGIIAALNQRFGTEWIILFRLHPNLKGKVASPFESKSVIDMTDYDDIQELLAISNFLITDYSSSMFDAALCDKICILYASDLENYLRSERKLYFDIQSLPFPLAENNEQLMQIIQTLDTDKYYSSIKLFLNQLGICENGLACENIERYLSDQIR